MFPFDKKEVANKAEVYHAWAAKHAAVNAQVVESHGLGLTAKTAVNTDEVFLRVPEELTFSTKTVTELAKEDERLAEWLSIDPQSGLHLLHRALLYLILFDQKKWLPYFKLLPDINAMNIPFTWSLEEIERLKGISIYEATMSKRMYLQDKYTKFFENQRVRDIVTASGREDVPLYMWLVVHAWISSRVVAHPETGESCLVPILDLCNHSAHPNVRYDFVDGQFVLVHDKTLHADIAAGDELLLNYGPEDCGKFFFSYGFIPDTADAITVKRLYDPNDPGVAQILDASKDPAVAEEDVEGIAGGYQLLIQFMGAPAQCLTLTEDDWHDEFILLIAADDMVELRLVDDEYGLYLGDVELVPGQIEEATKAHSEIKERGTALVSKLAEHFAAQLETVPSSQVKEVAEKERQLYKKFITTA